MIGNTFSKVCKKELISTVPLICYVFPSLASLQRPNMKRTMSGYINFLGLIIKNLQLSRKMLWNIVWHYLQDKIPLVVVAETGFSKDVNCNWIQGISSNSYIAGYKIIVLLQHCSTLIIACQQTFPLYNYIIQNSYTTVNTVGKNE